MSIDSAKNTGHMEERLLQSIDVVAEQAKDIVRVTSPIIEEIRVVIRSAERAFGQGDGPATGTATSTEIPGSGRPWTGKSTWTTLLGMGAAGCIVAYLMWQPR
jgi:hypothetical protein